MIQEYENTLRTLIVYVIGSDDNIDYGVSSERIQKWKEKRDIEVKKYEGRNIESRLLYYSDFYDLKTIVLKHWEKFKLAFNDKKRFEVLFSEIEMFRNTVSHGRSLLPHQQALLQGVVGDIKTRVVQFHNQNMNEDDFFLRIMKVSDNLGNYFDNPEYTHIADTILRVNDTLEIVIEAFDPKGREITYELSVQTLGIILRSKTGQFSTTITSDMVAKKRIFQIKAFTKGTEYKNKETVNILYTVLP